MQQTRYISPDHTERATILGSIGLNSDEPLLIAVEAMINQARAERPTHPSWNILGARNAEGIATAREALEAHGGWVRATSENRLEGVQHIDSGRFLAVHNTCERTGLDKGLPRFMSARKRSATKSLRDDLQGDFCELVEDFKPDEAELTPADELTLHLCVFIDRETLDTGEEMITSRAELVIGAICSDLGIVSSKYRIPLVVDGMVNSARRADGASPEDEGAVEAEISIRRKS